MLASRCLDLINREFTDLTVKRDLDGKGERFHCECKCGGYRTCSRRQLIARVVKSCAACAAKNKHVGNFNVEPPLPPEPKLARIELPECRGCTVRIIGGIRYKAVQPDCPRCSNLYRTPLPRGLEVAGGRVITSYRKAGLGHE